MRLRSAFAVAAAAGLLATACGGDDSGKADSATTAAAGAATTAGGTGSTGAPTGPSKVDPSLPPLKIGFMIQASGANAVANRANALKLAVDELNAAGGAYGHKIEYTEYDIGITPDISSVAVKKAI